MSFCARHKLLQQGSRSLEGLRHYGPVEERMLDIIPVGITKFSAYSSNSNTAQGLYRFRLLFDQVPLKRDLRCTLIIFRLDFLVIGSSVAAPYFR
jgi:hypothetical protein